MKLAWKLPSLPKISAALLVKIMIGVCVLWVLFMVFLVLLSGHDETKEATNLGKRFLVHVADGRVEGRLAANEGGSDTAKTIEVAPVTIEDGEAESSPPISSITASTNPIAEVSEEYLEKTNIGAIPALSKDKRKPWKYYSKNFKRKDEKPLISIIVMGLGHNRTLTEEALSLNENIVLSFSPYARGVASWSTGSRMTGHETFLDVPMQVAGFPLNDSGPNALLLTRTEAQNKASLYWSMSRFQGFAGVLTPPNEVLSTNMESYKSLVQELQRRGVLLVAGHSIIDKKTKEFLDTSTAEMITADTWIDEELSADAIQARLATLEQTAQRNGSAVGIMRAYPLTIEQLKIWEENLSERGANLAPVSFLAKLKFN